MPYGPGPRGGSNVSTWPRAGSRRPSTPDGPVAGSRWPSSPEPWAVYQTPPSTAGATSWGREPAGTGYSRSVGTRVACAAAAGIVALAGTVVAGAAPDGAVAGAAVAATGF